jgi:hypothetical protein
MGSLADFDPPQAGDPEQAFKFCIGQRRIANPGETGRPIRPAKAK